MKKVSVRKCNDYSYENVKESLEKLISDLGGLEKYITPSSKVLIKMNLLMKKRPEDATTTHPMVLKVLAEKLLDMNCEVIVADSPGGVYTPKVLRAVYRATGVEDVANDLNIKLNYDVSSTNVKCENGKIVKSIEVINPVLEADHVISLCKLKTHGMALFTGGVKNLFGVIPGLLKAEYHFKMPEVKEFTDLLVDICDYVNPTLTIMDGIIGMEGEGPSAGNPRKVGVLIGSESPYALDVIGCKIINIDPMKVPTIQRTVERNFLKEDFSDILVSGDCIDNLVVLDFKVPNIKSINLFNGKVPKVIERPLNAMLRPKPVFNESKCVACRECEKVCPPKVITMNSNIPKVDLDKCIRCFCCHELCPKKAVDIKRPLLFRIFK
ncbi:Uncharacterized conserved protein, DUF362 family [Alkalithermobacter thermoalcaliphilus JW-YL-7 = DSM 7308]|uniref:Ferredoxin n=1 Tax=Alkalithermobacter thermoalcaliphilus JW-YL-7 = DSM 7308 TaxID=1121328 RepID=A0A150FNX9_CLOPD|nr:protein of unknown function DUF362 [[Clostridium] paradoxum JW-YL-7 = DSM 7308]SHK84141.1 Uncharacterized conserved protein, DUF362 family [[Clostridium] paradoxum JW-YL-7 = DSM 7308]